MVDDEVADDDVLLVFDVQADTCQFGALHTHDGLVAFDGYDVLRAIQTSARHLALYNNNIRCRSASIGCQVIAVGDTHHLSAHTSRNAVDAIRVVDESHRAVLSP